MRILQIVPSISLVYGGPSQMVRGLSAGQAAAGAQVTVLTTNLNGDRGEAPLDVPVDRCVQENGYDIHYFPCGPFHRYKFSLSLLLWLWRHGKDYDIAHIHALFSPISTLAAMVCRWIGLPYWLRPLGTLDPQDLEKKRWLKKLYGWTLERANLAGAAALHFTSDEEARISARFGTRTRTVVIPAGVSLSEEPDPSWTLRSGSANSGTGPAIAPGASESPEPPRKIPTLLYMSRIAPKKGLDLLLPVLEQLAEEGVPFRFILAGSNPQDPVFEQTVDHWILNSRWLRDRTDITGFISGVRKREILARSDIFVLPSYYENFGLAVAEAMAVGVPVVISRGVHIWPTVAQAQAGWICDINRETLLTVLREALTDSPERSLRGRNARRCAAANYRWGDIAQLTLRAYQESLKTHPQGAEFRSI